MELNTLENFLLLAKHPYKGRFMISDLHIHHGIIGIIFLELHLEGVVSLENDKVIVKDDASTGHPFGVDLLERVKKSRRQRKLKTWIIKLSGKASAIKWSVLQALEKKGILSIEKRKFLFFIPYRKTYLLDQTIRDQLIEHLKVCAFKQKEPQQEDILLLGMIEACQMHKILSADKAERKLLKKELKILMKENAFAGAIDQSIRQVQAAVLAAITASTAAAAASSSR
ncbi:MAG: GPP34 family phosphoprotein [Bacteroidales bacterium]|nr:GPP34 family phosphoprotein [Bacteroidales bacterium]